MAMRLTSPSFRHLHEIPSLYTCQGRNISPPLTWTHVADAAKSLVLIVDDPDAPDPAAPKMTWVHWVLYNLPVGSEGLPEATAATNLPIGALEGLNDWKRTGYGGPCPPIGRHRYYFKLYALDLELPDLQIPTKAQLESVMENHIVERAELIGTYCKQ